MKCPNKNEEKPAKRKQVCRRCHWRKHQEWQHPLSGLCMQTELCSFAELRLIATWRHTRTAPLPRRAHGAHQWNSLCINSGAKQDCSFIKHMQWSSIKPLPANSQSETKEEGATVIFASQGYFHLQPDNLPQASTNVECWVAVFIPFNYHSQKSVQRTREQQATSDIAVPLVALFFLSKKH